MARRAVIRSGCLGALAVLLGACDIKEFLSGPNVDPTKADLKLARSNEIGLNQELFDLHKGLAMLSYGSSVPYGCGDPRNPRMVSFDRTMMGGVDLRERIAKGLPEDHSEAAKQTRGAIEFLEEYIKSIEQLRNQGKANEETINGIKAALDKAGPALAGVPPAGAAALVGSDLLGGAVLLNRADINRRIRELAQRLNEPVKQAIIRIKGHPEVFLQRQAALFVAWDSCARETIYYLRDSPTWSLPPSKALRFKASTGAELYTLWQAYITKRDVLLAKMLTQKDLEDHLDNLEKQQNALLTNGRLSFESLKMTGEALGNGVGHAKAAIDASQQ